MRRRFYPRVRKIELLAPRAGNFGTAPYRADLVKNVREAFINASRVFQNRLDYKTEDKGQKVSSVALVARDRKNSNIPMRESMLAQIGAAIGVLLETPLSGRMIKHWLFQSSASVPGEKTQQTGSALQLFIMTTGKENEYTNTVSTLQNLLLSADAWVMNPYPTDGKTFQEQQRDIKKLLKILTEDINPNFDADRDSAFIWSCLIKWVFTFNEFFGEHGKNDGPIWYQTVFHDLYKSLNDHSVMLSTFQRWYATKVYIDQQQDLRNRMRVDFSRVEINNGMIWLPSSFFEALVEFAVEDGLLCNLEFVNFQSGYEGWSSYLEIMSKYRAILKYENKEVDLDSSLDLFLPHSWTKVDDNGVVINVPITTKIEEILKEVQYFNEAYRLHNELWKKFCSSYFTSIFEDVLPRVAVRTTIENGIKAMYHFSFDTPHIKNYIGYRIRMERDSSGSDYKEVVVHDPIMELSQPVVQLHQQHDIVKNKMLMREQCGYYGWDGVDEEVKKVLIEQFVDSRVTKPAVDTWYYEEFDEAFTILPPKGIKREIDILETGSATGIPMVRAVDGGDYRLRQYDLRAAELSYLDLWFTYPRSELDNNTDLETLYNRRLRLLTEQRDFGPYGEFLKLPWDAVVTPNYAMMFAFANADFSNFYYSMRATRLIPAQFADAADMVALLAKNRRSRMVVLPRYIEIEFPVHKSNIYSSYLADLDGKDFVFKSAETRDSKPKFMIKKEQYSTFSFTDCFRGFLTIDLGFDVNLNKCKVNKVNTTTVTILMDVPVPGFENIDPNADDMFYIRSCLEGETGLIHPRDLCLSSIDANDVTTLWIELAMGLIRDALLGVWKINPSDGRPRGLSAWATELVEFYAETFVNVAGDLQVTQGGAYLVETEALLNALKVLANHTNLTALSEQHKKQFSDLLSSVYGEAFTRALPFGNFYLGSYYNLLKDVMTGVIRLPAEKRPITDLKRTIELTCIENSEIFTAIVNYYLNARFWEELRFDSNVNSQHEKKKKAKEGENN